MKIKFKVAYGPWVPGCMADISQIKSIVVADPTGKNWTFGSAEVEFIEDEPPKLKPVLGELAHKTLAELLGQPIKSIEFK